MRLGAKGVVLCRKRAQGIALRHGPVCLVRTTVSSNSGRARASVISVDPGLSYGSARQTGMRTVWANKCSPEIQIASVDQVARI